MASTSPRSTVPSDDSVVDSAADSAAIRQRALRRLVIAVVLLAAAFGALLTYERFSTPRMVTPVTRTVTPPVAMTPLPTEPVAAAEPEVQGLAASEGAAALPEPGTSAESGPAATSPAPAPGAAVASASKPPPPAPVVINNEAPATAPPAMQARPPAPPAGARPTPPAPPITPAQASPAPNSSPAKVDAQRGYVVQLGVFASPQNAESLQRKLAEAGVITSTETRVLIGPFRDRAEAERSLEIVRKLGVAAVVVPTR